MISLFCVDTTLLGKHWYLHFIDEQTGLEIPTPYKAPCGNMKINTQVHLTPCPVIFLSYCTTYVGLKEQNKITKPQGHFPVGIGRMEPWLNIGMRESARPRFSSTWTASHLLTVPSSLSERWFLRRPDGPCSTGSLWRLNGKDGECDCS